MNRHPPPLAPSDLCAARPTQHRVLVAGRVVDVSQHQLRLGDAFASWPVTLQGPEPLPRIAPGDHLIVSALFDGDQLLSAQLTEHHAHPVPSAPGEQARLVWGGVATNLRQRDRVAQAIRDWFHGQGFVEVNTPFWLKCPGIDANIEPVRSKGGYLVTSPEYAHKRLLVGGMPRIFEIARCAREEELGPLHQPEFTLVEWYRAFARVEEVMADTEALLRASCRALRSDLSVSARGRTIDLASPFLRLTVEEAFSTYAQEPDAIELARACPERFFELWVSAVEPGLANLDRPVFLHHFPATQAGLARPCPTDPRVAERFELYVGGVEMCNGYGELTDPSEHRIRFEAENQARVQCGLSPLPLDEAFLSALAEGLPPAAGNALGFDRLVLLLLGLDNLEQVLAFPRRQS